VNTDLLIVLQMIKVIQDLRKDKQTTSFEIALKHIEDQLIKVIIRDNGIKTTLS
jgi:hypothetical protein